MAGPNDFTGQNIQDTYQRVLQISSSGVITDGTGSIIQLTSSSIQTAITASHALFAVSASHEITFELSSSHAVNADTASFATNFTASGNISASGDIIGNNISASGDIDLGHYNGVADDPFIITSIMTTRGGKFGTLNNEKRGFSVVNSGTGHWGSKLQTVNNNPEMIRIDTDTWLCTECVSFDQAPPPKSCIDDNTECISKWGEQYICKQKLYECEQMAIHIMKLEASKKK